RQFHLLGWVRMSFAFQRGHPTLDGPDDVDKLLQGIRCFRRQLGLISDCLDRSFGGFQLATGHVQS
ncbi:MAG TPA: hypothetical protein VK561_20985, partial [Bradyrhizobium sp.]|nr:hypothetical protein [Bradyrhizobium sp.]